MGVWGTAIVRLPFGKCLRRKSIEATLCISIAGAIAICSAGQTANAQSEPKLPDLSPLVKSEEWAKVLGTALFWDRAAGSDGMACASCHFSAGADSRIINQLSPGLLEEPHSDFDFGAIEAADLNDLGKTASGAIADSNYELNAADFPFHQLEDEMDRNSKITITTNDRVSSAGAFDNEFKRVTGNLADECGPASPDVFHLQNSMSWRLATLSRSRRG